MVQGDSKHVKTPCLSKLQPFHSSQEYGLLTILLLQRLPRQDPCWGEQLRATWHMTHPQYCVYEFSWLKIQLTYKSPGGNPRTTTWLEKQGVCHNVALPFTLKCILRQKKNYGKSIISPFKNIIFKKSSKNNHNPSRYYNSITNLKFRVTQAKISSFKKSSYINRPIIT